MENELVSLKVVKLDSVKTQLPYEFYSLAFCKPLTVKEASENLGEILSGDKIESSDYEVSSFLSFLSLSQHTPFFLYHPNNFDNVTKRNDS